MFDPAVLQSLPKEVQSLLQLASIHSAPAFGSISLLLRAKTQSPRSAPVDGGTPLSVPHEPLSAPPLRERRFPRLPSDAVSAKHLDAVEASPGEPSTSGRGEIIAPRKTNNVKRIGTVSDAHHDEPDVVCIEVTKGRHRIYRARQQQHRDAYGIDGFDITDEKISHGNATRDFLAGYLLPQGYPDSVAPQYAQYMRWRACQYFFGGAMSVYTTRSLLSALGVGGRHKGEAAAAINWVVKDGAGRLGRFLFARWGRALDCELKQFRLVGDLLMECAAAMELSTIAAPKAFLPLACTANLAKNLAAVAASSTRAPIYRTFAKQNNLADVTAKGESVANLADIAGTIFGISLTRTKLPILPAFCLLSCGYLFASRKEVDAVELPYLNRARLSYSAQQYFSTGTVPSVQEANSHEPLLPWGASQRVVMGASVEEACDGPEELAKLLNTWQDRQYAVAYRPDMRKAYVVLREGAAPTDVLEGAFHAQHLLYKLDSLQRGQHAAVMPGYGAVEQLLSQVATEGRALFQGFREQAAQLGWKLQLTMLNPAETRLRVQVLEG